MLYGIVEDLAFHETTQNLIGDVGYLPSNISDYFSDQRTILDQRSSRLSIAYYDNYVAYQNFLDYIINDVYGQLLTQHYIDPNDPNDTALLTILYNDLLRVVNDNSLADGSTFTIDRQYAMKIVYDNLVLNEDDRNYITSMSSYEMDGLFNIIERATIAHVYQESLNDLDAALASDNTKYPYYLQGSIEISDRRVLGTIYDPNVNISRLIPPWIKFTLSKSGGYTLTVKVWLSRSYFEREYPFSIIVTVVPPADCNTLLNLSSLSNVYQALYESRETTMEKLSSLIGPGLEYSGLINFDVPYTVPGTTDTYTVTFLLLYRGIQPTDTVAKQAIRQYLLNTCTNGTLDEWRSRFPTLFIDNLFYMYTIWDEYFTTPNRDYHRAVIPNSKLSSIINKIQIINPSADISNYDILNAYYNSTLTLSMNDINNIDNITIYSLFPDYTRIQPTNEAFNLLDVSTRTFIINFNKALARANGETNELTITSHNNYGYVKFYVDTVEYYLLTKDAYNIMINL